MKTSYMHMVGYASVLIVIVVIIAAVGYIYKDALYKYGTLRTLSKIQYGSLFIMHDSGRPIFSIQKTPYPIAKIYVKDEPKFFGQLATRGDAGLGYAYTKGVWYVKNPEDLVSLISVLAANMKHIMPKYKLNDTFESNVEKDKQVVQHHYDVGNDFYQSFLKDPLMAYSCGFWLKPNDTLASAQYNKVNFIIRKLKAAPHHHILDIGCGWGKITQYVQQQTRADMECITISKEQIDFINSNIKGVRAYYGHYVPDTQTIYDRVYSIGMFEHVRCKNYYKFFKTVYDRMSTGGRFVLHTILTDRDDTKCDSGSTKIFLTEYIFPGGQIPKIEWVLRAAKRAGFKIVHIETVGGHHYAKTLHEWRQSMLASSGDLQAKGYSMETIKAYEYYMSECEAVFFLDEMQLTHFVFDKVENNSFITDDVFA